MEFLKKVVMKRNRKIGLFLASGPVIKEGFIFFWTSISKHCRALLEWSNREQDIPDSERGVIAGIEFGSG